MNQDQFLPPNTVDSTSRELLNRLKAGHQESWNFLIDIYGPIIAFWAKSARLPADDIRDVVQEVLLSITRNIDRFERAEGKAKFRAWLKAITHSKINDLFRKNVKVRQIRDSQLIEDLAAPEHKDPDECEIEFSDQENAAITQSVMWAIRDEFEENTWESFWRTAIDDRNSTDVADELGISSDAVRKNKSRVMKRLREVLSNYFG
jgi:RNA polymerase sigma-70 factor (ECF subfamily)